MFCARVSAHRLDEFLQAARIDVEPDRVRLEMSLTPGVAVADRVIREIDVDRNGALSQGEKRAYAGRVLGALTLRLDDSRLLPIAMTASSVPDLAALRSGDGAIVIHAETTIPPLPAGPHRIAFHNGNVAEGSVYLANALVPEDDVVAVTAQHHAADQRALTIEFVRSRRAVVRAALGVDRRWGRWGG